jgi:hypothetical protein
MRRVKRDAQLQIRLTAAQKQQVEEKARRAGKTVSALVLDTVLGMEGKRFQRLIRELAAADAERERLVWAEIHDFLEELDAGEFEGSLPVPAAGLEPRRSNILAAMVEFAARRKGVTPPSWTAAIPPLEMPVFGSELRSLREYLLVWAPVEFRRRNLFVDASIGARV